MAERKWNSPRFFVSLYGDQTAARRLISRARKYAGYLFDQLRPGQTYRTQMWKEQDGALIQLFVWRDSIGERVFSKIYSSQAAGVLPTKVGDIIEHGLYYTSEGVDHIYLSSALQSYYAGLGSLLCGTYQHVYGAVEIQSEQCTDNEDALVWLDETPDDGDASLVPAEQKAYYNEDYRREPHAYTGLMRLYAQVHQAFRSIVSLLYTSEPGVAELEISKEDTGIIRDHVFDTRLKYYRVRVSSAGVWVFPLVWADEANAAAQIVLTGKTYNESGVLESVSSEQRILAEAVLFQFLKADPNGAWEEIVTPEALESVVETPTWQYICGWPHWSPQMWGQGSEQLCKCVVTITITGDGWPFPSKAFEIDFSFDASTGAVSADVSVIASGFYGQNNTDRLLYYKDLRPLSNPTHCLFSPDSESNGETPSKAPVHAWITNAGVTQILFHHPAEVKTVVSDAFLDDHYCDCSGIGLGVSESSTDTTYNSGGWEIDGYTVGRMTLRGAETYSYQKRELVYRNTGSMLSLRRDSTTANMINSLNDFMNDSRNLCGEDPYEWAESQTPSGWTFLSVSWVRDDGEGYDIHEAQARVDYEKYYSTGREVRSDAYIGGPSTDSIVLVERQSANVILNNKTTYLHESVPGDKFVAADIQCTNCKIYVQQWNPVEGKNIRKYVSIGPSPVFTLPILDSNGSAGCSYNSFGYVDAARTVQIDQRISSSSTEYGPTGITHEATAVLVGSDGQGVELLDDYDDWYYNSIENTVPAPCQSGLLFDVINSYMGSNVHRDGPLRTDYELVSDYFDAPFSLPANFSRTGFFVGLS